MAFIVAAHRSPQTRRIVESVLTRAGHTVVLFGDGSRALAEICAGMPDLVILDDQLPGMSGLETRAAMRSCPPLAAVPVILCSTTLAPPEIDAMHADGDRTLRPALLATRLAATVEQALAGVARQLAGVAG